MSTSTLIVVKPDGVRRKLVGKILARFEERDFEIKNVKYIHVNREFGGKHYEEHRGKDFFERLLDDITAGPVVAVEISGPIGIVQTVRQMIGTTDPMTASSGTIRGDFAKERRFNVIHASDSDESAKRELELWFN